MSASLPDPTCPGWALVEKDGELSLDLCNACGFPGGEKILAAEAALTSVEALFGARFGDDSNRVLELLESALWTAADRTDSRVLEAEYLDALACVRGVLKSIREAAEE